MAELICSCCAGRYRYHVSGEGRRYIIETKGDTIGHRATNIRYLTAYENQGRRMRKKRWWNRTTAIDREADGQ